MEATTHYFRPRDPATKGEPPPPWWKKECGKALSAARNKRREWLESKRLQAPQQPPSILTTELKTELNRLEAKKKKLCYKLEKEAWETHINTLEKTGDKKKFWSYVKSVAHGKSTTPAHDIKDENGILTSDPKKKADIFGRHYFSWHSRPNHQINNREARMEEKIEDAIRNETPNDLNLPFTELEWNQALSNLPDKAMGADRIHNKMLKNLSQNNRRLLLELLNKMYQNGFVPEDWKNAVVVPIPKPGKPLDDPDGHRPISLTSCLAKAEERMINTRLYWHLERNNYLPKHQAGFRAGYSTKDHIIRLESAAKTALNDGKMTAAVFLDLTKAYDVAWINGILFKLTKMKISGHLLKWLKNFLTGRTAQVLITGALSREYQLTMGVPQGSVLSPLLFNVLMSDFPKPDDDDIEVATYADDIEFHVSCDTSADAKLKLQAYIYKIEEWAFLWKLKFSVGKCAAMLITRRRRYVGNLRLTLEAEPIGEVEKFKFLGVTFNSRLTWVDHIENLARSINRSANLIYSLVSSKICLGLNSLIRVFKAMIRSKMDYGAAVLVSSLPTHYKRLDVIQNKILRRILGAFSSTPIALMNLETGTTSIMDRWKYLAGRYVLNLAHKRSNPAYKAVREIKNHHAPEWRPRTTPAAIITLEEIEQVDLFTYPATNRRADIPPTPTWTLPSITYKIFPMTKREAIADPHRARALFREWATANSRDHCTFYTDGSKVDDSCACAFFCPSLQLSKSWKLDGSCSTLTCELWAILKALEAIYQEDFPSCTIFTDSLSAVRSISNLRTGNRLIYQIAEKISNCLSSGTLTTVAWVPSHVGIIGNETADHLANQGRLHPSEGTIYNTQTAAEMITIYKTRWKERIVNNLKGPPRLVMLENGEEADTRNVAIAHRIKHGPLPWHLHKKRNKQTITFRLRSGHNKLNSTTGRWERNDEQNRGCPNCDAEKETSKHVLMECPEYDVIRATMRESLPFLGDAEWTLPSILGLNSELTSKQQLQIRDAVYKFIRDAKILDRI